MYKTIPQVLLAVAEYLEDVAPTSHAVREDSPYLCDLLGGGRTAGPYAYPFRPLCAEGVSDAALKLLRLMGMGTGLSEFSQVSAAYDDSIAAKLGPRSRPAIEARQTFVLFARQFAMAEKLRSPVDLDDYIWRHKL